MTRIAIRVARRLAGEAGYTLTELITVMAILAIVLAGLTAMFHRGIRAEVRASRELEAQQNARLALDRMRRELHCASAISAPNGTRCRPSRSRSRRPARAAATTVDVRDRDRRDGPLPAHAHRQTRARPSPSPTT